MENIKEVVHSRFDDNSLNSPPSNSLMFDFDNDKNLKTIRFFKLKDDPNDASHLVWSHAVNNKEFLIRALDDVRVHFLEADIVFIESKHVEPIMAHPPQTDSDLKFSEWLILSKSSGKGLKLDFKTDNSLIPCLSILNSVKNEVTHF